MNVPYINNTSLADLNSKNVKTLIAPIIFLFILLIIGVSGNLTVLCIYYRQYKQCVYRTIIWNLAIVDLCMCTLGLPFNISRIFSFYTFQGLWACKIFKALLTYGMVYSTNLLLLLSLHRFRQICMPLKKQISLTKVRYFILGCVFTGLFMASPQLAITDMDQIDLGYNMTVHTCPITARHPSACSIVYSTILLSVFIIATLVLLVTYLLIGRTLYVQKQKRLGDRRTDANDNMSDKITKIAFTISLVFAMSYIPLMALKIAQGWYDESDMNMIVFGIIKIAERLYLVNHVANPFIYAVFDQQFRKHLKSIGSLTCIYNENIEFEPPTDITL